MDKQKLVSVYIFTYIVNSTKVAWNEIEVKYFETGHTFMSADSFHHQVERSLKKLAKFVISTILFHVYKVQILVR